jgi:hypothetical protein
MCALEALTDSSSEGFLFADRRDDVVSNPASLSRGGACRAHRHDSAAPVRPTGNSPRIHSSSELGVHHPKCLSPFRFRSGTASYALRGSLSFEYPNDFKICAVCSPSNGGGKR